MKNWMKLIIIINLVGFLISKMDYGTLISRFESKPIVDGYERVVEIINDIETNPNYRRETKEERTDSGKLRRTYEFIYDEKGNILAEKTSKNLLTITGKYENNATGKVLYYWYNGNGNHTYLINAYGLLSWSEYKYDETGKKIEWWSKDKFKVTQNSLKEYYENGNMKKDRWNYFQENQLYKFEEKFYSEDGRWLKTNKAKKVENDFILFEVTEAYEWNEKNEYIKLRRYLGNKEKLKEDVHLTLNENGQVINVKKIDGNGVIISEKEIKIYN